MAISPLSDFNTSYVVIKQDNEKNETHGCVISIHHMLLLNVPTVLVKGLEVAFQYIICCY